MPLGWEGRKIRLVPLEHELHFDNCVRWLNDPVVTAWTLIGDYPLTRVAEGDFFDRVARQSDTDIVFAIELLAEEREHVGVCGLHNVNYRHGTGVLGIIIGRPQLWGRGLGSDAIAVMTHYAFDVAGLRLILSEALAENVASIRAQLKCGYQQLGCIPQRYWKRGAFRDAIQFCLTRDDWSRSQAPAAAGASHA